jgi:glycosyltransferase involved in cell wall biosynthesis
MTAYNREQYIGFAIESVLASTFKDFEFIIVDDHSTDQTLSVIKQYAAKDNRIRYFVNEHNLGDYPNRNYAASLASGKYLKYVDSDDYIYPNGLEIMVSGMERNPQAAWGISSLQPDNTIPFPFVLDPKGSYNYHFFGPGLFHKGPLAVIIKKETFDSTGPFSTQRMISDTDLWYKLALKHPVVLFQDGVVWQRRHPNQELSDQKNYITAGEKLKWKYLLSEDCLLTREQVSKVKSGRIRRYTGFIASGLKKFDFELVKIYVKCLLYVIRIKV